MHHLTPGQPDSGYAAGRSIFLLLLRSTNNNEDVSRTLRIKKASRKKKHQQSPQIK